jgi:hypothetical protein
MDQSEFVYKTKYFDATMSPDHLNLQRKDFYYILFNREQQCHSPKVLQQIDSRSVTKEFKEEK